jgi:hypothetical protein
VLLSRQATPEPRAQVGQADGGTPRQLSHSMFVCSCPPRPQYMSFDIFHIQNERGCIKVNLPPSSGRLHADPRGCGHLRQGLRWPGPRSAAGAPASSPLHFRALSRV